MNLLKNETDWNKLLDNPIFSKLAVKQYASLKAMHTDLHEKQS